MLLETQPNRSVLSPSPDELVYQFASKIKNIFRPNFGATKVFTFRDRQSMLWVVVERDHLSNINQCGIVESDHSYGGYGFCAFSLIETLDATKRSLLRVNNLFWHGADRAPKMADIVECLRSVIASNSTHDIIVKWDGLSQATESAKRIDFLPNEIQLDPNSAHGYAEDPRTGREIEISELMSEGQFEAAANMIRQSIKQRSAPRLLDYASHLHQLGYGFDELFSGSAKENDLDLSPYALSLLLQNQDLGGSAELDILKDLSQSIESILGPLSRLPAIYDSFLFRFACAWELKDRITATKALETLLERSEDKFIVVKKLSALLEQSLEDEQAIELWSRFSDHCRVPVVIQLTQFELARLHMKSNPKTASECLLGTTVGDFDQLWKKIDQLGCADEVLVQLLSDERLEEFDHIFEIAKQKIGFDRQCQILKQRIKIKPLPSDSVYSEWMAILVSYDGCWPPTAKNWFFEKISSGLYDLALEFWELCFEKFDKSVLVKDWDKLLEQILKSNDDRSVKLAARFWLDLQQEHVSGAKLSGFDWSQNSTLREALIEILGEWLTTNYSSLPPLEILLMRALLPPQLRLQTIERNLVKSTAIDDEERYQLSIEAGELADLLGDQDAFVRHLLHASSFGLLPEAHAQFLIEGLAKSGEWPKVGQIVEAQIGFGDDKNTMVLLKAASRFFTMGRDAITPVIWQLARKSLYFEVLTPQQTKLFSEFEATAEEWGRSFNLKVIKDSIKSGNTEVLVDALERVANFEEAADLKIWLEAQFSHCIEKHDDITATRICITLIESGYFIPELPATLIELGIGLGDLDIVMIALRASLIHLRSKSDAFSFYHDFHDSIKVGLGSDFWCDLANRFAEVRGDQAIPLSIRSQFLKISGLDLVEQGKFDETGFKCLSYAFELDKHDKEIWLPLYFLTKKYADLSEIARLLEEIVPRIEANPEVLEGLPFAIASLREERKALRGQHSNRVKVSGDSSFELAQTPFLGSENLLPPVPKREKRIDWRAIDASGPKLDSTELTAYIETAFENGLDKHLGVQYMSLLARDIASCHDWVMQVWRRPEDFCFEIDGTSRLEAQPRSLLPESIDLLLGPLKPVVATLHQTIMSERQELVDQSGQEKVARADDLMDHIGAAPFWDIWQNLGMQFHHYTGQSAPIFSSPFESKIYLRDEIYLVEPPTVGRYDIHKYYWASRFGIASVVDVLSSSPAQNVIEEILRSLANVKKGKKQLNSFLWQGRTEPVQLTIDLSTIALDPAEALAAQSLSWPLEWRKLNMALLKLTLADSLDLFGVIENYSGTDLVASGSSSAIDILLQNPDVVSLVEFSKSLRLAGE